MEGVPSLNHVFSVLLAIVVTVNGNWEPKRVTLRRICKGSEIEILSRQGVKLEPYEKSRVELALVNPGVISTRKKFRLSFDFKTTSPSGVLFYGRNREYSDELIALSLHQGELIYTIQCPTLHAEVLLPTPKRFDDGLWHKVSYNVTYRRGHRGYLSVDGYALSRRYDISCSHMTAMVMGGTSPKDRRHLRSLNQIKHFDGCIRNVRIPTALRLPPKYYAVSICN